MTRPHRAALNAASRQIRLGLGLGLLLTAFIDGAVLVVPLYDMQLYDRVLMSRNMDTLLLLSLACAVGLGMFALLEWLRAACFAAIAGQVVRRLRPTLLRGALARGLEGNAAGGAEAVRALERLHGFFASGALAVPLDALCAPLLLAVLFMLHPAYGWLGLGGAAALVLIGLVSDIWARPAVAAAHARAVAAAARLGDGLRDPELTEGLGLLPAMARRWAAEHAAALEAERRAQAVAQGLATVAKIARLILQAGVMALGAVLILPHEVTPGSLMGANLLINKLLGPFDHLVGNWRQWASARADWRRVAALPEAPRPAADTPADGPPGLLLAEVAVRDPGGRALLHDVNLRIEPGHAVAVMGPNGAGKSTLLRLLAGLILPAEGQVLLDGVPAHQVAGGRIGYLPQSVGLLAGNVGDNVARFTAAPADAAVAACRRAGVHELVGRLRRGYDTALGSDGVGLSGGQAQRIALARALFAGPRLLVLDEPDASLDHEGSAALVAAIAEVRRTGGIVVATTHRAALLEAMDLVLVLCDGAVESFGPRDQTIAAVPVGKVVSA
jgi:ATP-binding cassette subfamily C protein